MLQSSSRKIGGIEGMAYLQNCPSDQYIKKIQIYEKKCETTILKILNAKHCYAICTLSDYSKILVERGKNTFYVVKSPTHDGKLIGTQFTKTSVKDLFNKLHLQCKRNSYGLFNNNCYNFMEQLCKFSKQCDLSQQKIVKGINNIAVDQAVNFSRVIRINQINSSYMGLINGEIQIEKQKGQE